MTLYVKTRPDIWTGERESAGPRYEVPTTLWLSKSFSGIPFTTRCAGEHGSTEKAGRGDCWISIRQLSQTIPVTMSKQAFFAFISPDAGFEIQQCFCSSGVHGV